MPPIKRFPPGPAAPRALPPCYTTVPTDCTTTEIANSYLPVPPALNMTGDVASDWKFFKDRWQNYEIASGLAQKHMNVRLATLKVMMGKDCYEILQRLPDSESHTTVEAKAVHDYISNMTNAVYEHISKCAIRNEFQPQQQNEPLIPHETPKLPWAEVAVDLFTFDSDKYVVTVKSFFRFFRSGTAARYNHDIGGGNAQAFVRNARHSSDRSDWQRPAASFWRV